MFKVYGKTGCTWCVAVLEYLEFQGHPVEYINLEESPEDLEFIRDSGFKSVPQVFHGEDHVGGYQDTVRYVTNL